MQERSSGFVAMLIAALSALVASLLFVVALVVWLAEVFDSIALPCLIVGVFCAIFAVALYRLSIRPMVSRFTAQFAVIYDVMRLARDGMDLVTKFLFRR